MKSIVEALHKTKTAVQLGWNREPGAVSYDVYVGLGPDISLLVLLASGIPDIPDSVPATRGKVTYVANIGDIQSLLSIPTTWDFSNKVFYFAIVYTNALGVTSSLTESAIVEVPPVGIIPKLMKDDPTINRHEYVFSNEIQRWTKMLGSASGAVITDTADFYKSNITTEYIYDGTNLLAMKSYPSDATNPGMPAKLTTYSYSGGLLVKVQITDSTI